MEGLIYFWDAAKRACFAQGCATRQNVWVLRCLCWALYVEVSHIDQRTLGLEKLARLCKILLLEIYQSLAIYMRKLERFPKDYNIKLIKFQQITKLCFSRNLLSDIVFHSWRGYANGTHTSIVHRMYVHATFSPTIISNSASGKHSYVVYNLISARCINILS